MKKIKVIARGWINKQDIKEREFVLYDEKKDVFVLFESQRDKKTIKIKIIKDI